MQEGKKFACRCCGFLTLEEEPFGTYEICPVCFWEDDYVQVIEPTWTGANHVTLSEAKENFTRFCASEEKLKPCVRAPYPEEYPS
jgi:hypothetical protein